jgi:hypothetical protein
MVRLYLNRANVKFVRTTYPRIPGYEHIDSPCWQLTGSRFWLDADWNTHFPFGISLGLNLGRREDTPHELECAEDCQCRRHPLPRGLCLEVNAPLGEPNRLYVHGPRWHVTVGLISWWTFRETGREGRMIEGEYVRCRPHLDGIIRYRYHKDESGEWVRDDKPAPGHWGWLTIERANRAIAG